MELQRLVNTMVNWRKAQGGKVAAHLGSPGGQGLYLPLSLPTEVLSDSPASREKTSLEILGSCMHSGLGTPRA